MIYHHKCTFRITDPSRRFKKITLNLRLEPNLGNAIGTMVTQVQVKADMLSHSIQTLIQRWLTNGGTDINNSVQ